jgi:hypothetical protein
MERSTIIAGATAAGGILAAILVPRGKFLLGALIGAGAGAAASVAATTKKAPTPPPSLPEEPVYTPPEEPMWSSPEDQGGYVVINGQLIPIAPVFVDSLVTQPQLAQAGGIVTGQYDVFLEDEDSLGEEIKKLESLEDTVRNKRQEAQSPFEHFDQEGNQKLNMLYEVMKARSEMMRDRPIF